MKKTLRKIAHEVGLTENDSQPIRSIFGFGKEEGRVKPQVARSPAKAGERPARPEQTQTSGERPNWAEPPVMEEIEPQDSDAEETVPIWWRPDGRGSVFTDAIAPVIVSAMSGLALRRTPLSTNEERMIAGASVPPGVRGGVLHVWGAGLSGSNETRMKPPTGYEAPEGLSFAVYATRGPYSAAMFNAIGIDAPAIYGDPVCFAPKVLSFDSIEKDVELGVIAPPSSDPSATLKPRYEIPSSLRGAVEMIDLSCDGSMASLQAKAFDIARCKRLIVAAPHVAPLAEALSLPIAVFGVGARGPVRARVGDESVLFPARARDAYAGMGAESVTVYCQPHDEATDWDAVVRAIDDMWSPAQFDPLPLFESFPTEIVAPFESPRWAIERVDRTTIAPVSADKVDT